ncbi:MAG: P1 family peptidase [Caldisericaceae bacterium]
MGSITDIRGIQIGHSAHGESLTGCTVVIARNGVTAGIDVRGGAPGTHETDLLNPVNLVEKINAIYISGGSSFGLSGVSGVMKYLEEQGIGFDTGYAKVPIVPAAIIYDLDIGNPHVRPDADMGYKACLNASENNELQGNVGAGIGATVGKVRGIRFAMKGGLGMASKHIGQLVVAALVVVNALGDIIDPTSGSIIAGSLQDDKQSFINSEQYIINGPKVQQQFKNTTIGVVATNATLSKASATRIAIMSSDGLARAIRPSHTLFDGDTMFAVSTDEIKSDITQIGTIAQELVAEAIVNAIVNAKSVSNVISYQELRRQK